MNQKEVFMLEPLFGSATKEKILVYILCREEGYGREIAGFFKTPLNPVLQQLKKLEAGNVLFTRTKGRTKIYQFNPRFPFLKELKALLEKVVTFYPEETTQLLYYDRRRPRKNNKEL